jgi:hypothetical protein
MDKIGKFLSRRRQKPKVKAEELEPALMP